MRILVRAPNWIGDQVMAYPFFYLLRKAYPSAWIGVVCNEWVKDIQFSDLINEIFTFQKKTSKVDTFKSIFSLAKKIKKNGTWDLGIALPNSFGSALLLRLAGVKKRRGYATDARNFLLNEPIVWDPSPTLHRVEAYGKLLPDVAQEKDSLREFWKRAEKFDPIIQWPLAQAIEPPAEKYWVVAPGAVADSRRWSKESYAELIQLVSKSLGYPAVVVGGKSEQEIARYFEQQNLPVINKVNQGRVSSLWKIFSHAQFTVCNESGLAHLASLCGSQVIIVCGAADPKRTQPIGPGKAQVIINPVECWPCERNVCLFTDHRKNQCLKGIFPHRVFNEIKSLNEVKNAT